MYSEAHAVMKSPNASFLSIYSPIIKQHMGHTWHCEEKHLTGYNRYLSVIGLSPMYINTSEECDNWSMGEGYILS